MIADKKKCLFIHINRCAGNSMEKILRPYTNGMYGIPKRSPTKRPKHMTALDHLNFMGKPKFKSYYSFSFVRNPWDKTLSYFFLQRTKYHRDLRKISFSDWLKSDFFVTLDKQRSYIYRKYTSQYDWLTNKRGKMVVNFVGKFENVKQDWKKVAKTIGVQTKLPHVNSTDHEHYSTYYNQESIDIVAELFHKDIEHFDYDFEDRR